MYLRRGDAIIAILCMGVSISTTIVDQWLANSLIFNVSNKCITTNGDKIISVGVDNNYNVKRQKFSPYKISYIGCTESYLLYIYGTYS